MQTSLNKFAETLSNNRIDADFFKPEYIRSYTSVVSKKNTSLADVAHISDGNHLKIAEEFSNVSGVRYLRGQDISTDMMLSDRNIVYIPDSSFKTLNRSHIYKNDILITIVGANTGLVGLVYSPPEKLVASCKLGIIRPRKILSGYLYSFLITKYGQHQVFRNIRGGGQTGLILPDLKKIKVVRLGEDFEKLIHDIVYCAHKNANESLTIYNRAEQILLSELGLLNWKSKHHLSFIKNFSNTKSVDRVDAEYFQPMYEEIIKAVKSSKQYASLGNIISIKKCIEPGSEAYQDDGVPFVRVSNLSKIGINNDNQQYLSESLYETLKMHQPKKGEILLSKDATPGIAYYLKDTPGKMIPSGGILRLTVKDFDSIYPEYLTLVLNSVVVQKQIERDAGGSIINHWLVDQVKNTLIPILPASVQKEISAKIGESFSGREKSKHLLDIAKRGVELAIEKSEKDAEKWIAEEMNEKMNA